MRGNEEPHSQKYKVYFPLHEKLAGFEGLFPDSNMT